jgi:hypothetical protein
MRRLTLTVAALSVGLTLLSWSEVEARGRRSCGCEEVVCSPCADRPHLGWFAYCCGDDGKWHKIRPLPYLSKHEANEACKKHCKGEALVAPIDVGDLEGTDCPGRRGVRDGQYYAYCCQSDGTWGPAHQFATSQQAQNWCETPGNCSSSCLVTGRSDMEHFSCPFGIEKCEYDCSSSCGHHRRCFHRWGGRCR